MSKKEKESEAKAEEEAEVEAEADPEVEPEEQEPLETDYEAVAKAEQERLDKQAIADAEYKMRETKHDKEKIEKEEDEKPLTRKEMQDLLLKERQAAQKEFQEAKALEIARGLTSSESEAQAALLYWKSRVIPTGDLNADISFAVGGLNHKKVVAKNLELARALRGRDGVTTDFAGTYRDAPEGTEPKLDASTKASYTRAGFTYDTKDKVWKKKLPSGKFLIKDPRTKSTRVS